MRLARIYGPNGITPDLPEAIKLYKKALELNKKEAEAAYNLYKIYRNNGNMGEALKYLTLASDLKHEYALVELALCYETGYGDFLPQDQEKSIPLLKSAAKRDRFAAFYHLGLCYKEGGGVPKSDSRAMTCFKKCIKKCDADIHFSYAFEAAAEELYHYAHLDKEGKENPLDYEQVIDLLRFAARGGHQQAQSELIHFLKEAKERTPQLEKAFKWLKKEVVEENAKMQYELSNFYEVGGMWVSRNSEEALGWLRRAAENGNLDAQVKLGNYSITSSGNKN